MGTLRFSSLLLAVGLGGVLFLQSCRNNNPSKTKAPQTKTLEYDKKVERMTPLEVGFAISLGRITKDTLVLAKSLGIDHIEISGLGMFVDKERCGARDFSEPQAAAKIPRRSRPLEQGEFT